MPLSRTSTANPSTAQRTGGERHGNGSRWRLNSRKTCSAIHPRLCRACHHAVRGRVMRTARARHSGVKASYALKECPLFERPTRVHVLYKRPEIPAKRELSGELETAADCGAAEQVE